jgi:phage tail-like protein
MAPSWAASARAAAGAASESVRPRGSDPLLGARFRVEIHSINVAGFSEVSGLEAQVEVEEYQEGGENTHTHRLPTRVTYPNLVLRRGFVDARLWAWFYQTARIVDIRMRSGGASGRSSADGSGESDDEKYNVALVLCDTAGADVCRWGFRNAYPVRWEGPGLQADQGAVAVEAVELTHEGLMYEGVPPG